MASTSALEALVPVSGSKRSWSNFKVGNAVRMQVPNGLEGESEDRTPITCPFCMDRFWTKSTNIPRNKSLVCRTHLNTRACKEKRGALDEGVSADSTAASTAIAAAPAICVASEAAASTTIVDQVPHSRQPGKKHEGCIARQKELEERIEFIRAAGQKEFDDLKQRMNSVEQHCSFVEDVFVGVLPSLKHVRPFMEHQAVLKHHVELGVSSIQRPMLLPPAEDDERVRMEVRLRDREKRIVELEEEARLREIKHRAAIELLEQEKQTMRAELQLLKQRTDARSTVCAIKSHRKGENRAAKVARDYHMSGKPSDGYMEKLKNRRPHLFSYITGEIHALHSDFDSSDSECEQEVTRAVASTRAGRTSRSSTPVNGSPSDLMRYAEQALFRRD